MYFIHIAFKSTIGNNVYFSRVFFQYQVGFSAFVQANALQSKVTALLMASSGEYKNEDYQNHIHKKATSSLFLNEMVVKIKKRAQRLNYILNHVPIQIIPSGVIIVINVFHKGLYGPPSRGGVSTSILRKPIDTCD